MTIRTPIIYRNLTNDVFLLDLPLSLQDGQSSSQQIRSSIAPSQPYTSTEPKGHKLKKIKASIPPVDRHLHQRWEESIEAALNEIKGINHVDSAIWCYQRVERRDQSVSRVGGHGAGNSHTRGSVLGVPVVLSSTEEDTRFSSFDILTSTLVCNPHQSQTSTIAVSEVRYLIPPNSAFILGSINDVLPVLRSCANVFLPPISCRTQRGQFDLILMDPPWSNRSVRRAGIYATEEVHAGVFQSALSIVQVHLADEGSVALWVTNKPAIRAQVLHELQTLGFHLYEEWIWCKTTVRGEPVSQLDGVWRKPYEVLMLFRRSRLVNKVSHRVIVAVPDLHSRKPCLKRLFDEFLPTPYRALEVFARSLTAGWWSVGDEVLKFQDEVEWQTI